jgi:hypothetical protein
MIRHGVVLGGPTRLEGFEYYTVQDVEIELSSVVVARHFLVVMDPLGPPSWLRQPHYDLCPGCEEQDYFLDDDYICASCRLG